MTLIAMLRHAPTAWNRDKRLQGRADIPITPESRVDLTRKRVPEPFGRWPAISSPLSRCLETAAALGLAAAPEPRLIEMDWGEYQGQTIHALRARHGEAFRASERSGLDMRPPGGESPRDVMQRVEPVLAAIARNGASTLAITHRGVIRAVYAAAVGWDMTDDPPHALQLYGTLQIFELDADGRPRVEALNVPLVAR